MFLRNVRVHGLILLALAATGVTAAAAQTTGTIRGTVTQSGDNAILAGVQVTVRGVGVATVTNANGKYLLQRVPTGPQTIIFKWLGYTPVEKTITVSAETNVDASLEPKPVSLADLSVSAVSREPERSVQAPAASTSIEPRVLQSNSATGQVPLALAQAPGVDIVQSGINDFNINARGFNSSLNRRVLTLLDGRDLAIAFLGSQEWSSIPTATADLGAMELVRGPGSALYGPNAFAGVLNMTTVSPRESQGAKLTVSGGGLSSYRIDGRWATVLSEGRWGIRVTGGYGSNDTWNRSRTSIDSAGKFSFALRNEYKGHTDSIVKASSPELVPLAGQTLSPVVVTGGIPTRAEATGDRDAITSLYGTARLDRYFTSGAVATVEGGLSQSENETLVTGIGRIQVLKGFKPYGRVAYNTEHFNFFAYLNHRTSDTGQVSLASGAKLTEVASISHVEGQGNVDFLTNGKAIGGVSYRNYSVNTDGTLMRPEDDNRSDYIASAYGQVEYKFSGMLRLVGAARYDVGTLFDGQFSPKVAVVFSPTPNHSFRATYNQAFQTPNYSEYFLRAAAGAPANLLPLEMALRGSALGPALAGVPVGALYTTSSAVPVTARGNKNLTVETNTGYELGYKGSLTPKLYVTVDAYQNDIANFVTDLLPGVNPAQFPYWTAPNEVPAPYRQAVVDATRANLASNPAAQAGITRVEDGSTQVVASYANAGAVRQKGLDIGLGYQFSDEWRADGSISWFDFTVTEATIAGDKLLPNTPENKETLSLSYDGSHNRFDASISGRFIEGYQWAAGVFSGWIPATQTFNATAGYQFSTRYRLFATGTNVFNKESFQLYGGAVVGRRLIVGVTGSF